MKIMGDTHIGLVRENNQDALSFAPIGEQRAYAIVCDGMGGANGGNIASDIAVHILADRIRDSFREDVPVRSPDRLLASAIEAANIGVYDRAQQSPELEGMGTTVVVAVLCGNTAYISHVGDSRLYLMREGKLTQVTRDHSVVQEMIERGQLTEQEAKNHPRRHFITRAIGVQEFEQGEYDELDILPGDRLLLCTDGLTNMVDREKIAALLTDGPPEKAVERLIGAALDGGGTDNVTAVVINTDGCEERNGH